MPVTDEATAVDLMLTHFKTAWDAQGGTVPPVVYENTPGDPPKDGSPYVKVFVRHFDSRQATLARPGGRRFRKAGILTFEVYSRVGVGVTADANYAKVIRGAFEGSTTAPDGIWFRNARKIEQGVRADMWLEDVLVDFEYDTIN